MAKKNYYEKKSELILRLIDHLEKEEELLLRGDAHHALQWESENEKVLNQLIQLDKEKEEELGESLPSDKVEILKNSEIYELMERARTIQMRVQNLLEKERDLARKELNEVSIRRQLKVQLKNPDGLYWKKRIC